MGIAPAAVIAAVPGVIAAFNSLFGEAGARCPTVDPALIEELFKRLTPAEEAQWVSLDTGKRNTTRLIQQRDAYGLSQAIAQSDCENPHPLSTRFFQLLDSMALQTPPTVTPPSITYTPPSVAPGFTPQSGGFLQAGAGGSSLPLLAAGVAALVILPRLIGDQRKRNPPRRRRR